MEKGGHGTGIETVHHLVMSVLFLRTQLVRFVFITYMIILPGLKTLAAAFPD